VKKENGFVPMQLDSIAHGHTLMIVGFRPDDLQNIQILVF